MVYAAVTNLTACSGKPHVIWTAYTPAVMEQALHSGKPVFAYFYAAWCGPCMQLKEHTFTDPRVIAALEPYHRIKVDMSYIHSKKIQKIREDYEIPGLPTLILFDTSGRSYNRHSGFIDAENLLSELRKFKE